MMIFADSSFILSLLVADDRYQNSADKWKRALGDSGNLTISDFVELEVRNVLRKYTRGAPAGGKLSAVEAEEALRRFESYKAQKLVVFAMRNANAKYLAGAADSILSAQKPAIGVGALDAILVAVALRVVSKELRVPAGETAVFLSFDLNLRKLARNVGFRVEPPMAEERGRK